MGAGSSSQSTGLKVPLLGRLATDEDEEEEDDYYHNHPESPRNLSTTSSYGDMILSGPSSPDEETSELIPLPKSRQLNLYTPKILLETVTSSCALGIFIFVYTFFALCTLLILFEASHSKETIDLVPAIPCQSINPLDTFSCLEYTDVGPYQTIFYANLSIEKNLIGGEHLLIYMVFRLADLPEMGVLLTVFHALLSMSWCAQRCHFRLLSTTSQIIVSIAHCPHQPSMM